MICDLCRGARKVSYFVAAAWLSEHPEAHDTPAEMEAVVQPEMDDPVEPER